MTATKSSPVVYATKNGSTQQVAKAIADTLRGSGVTVNAGRKLTPLLLLGF